MSKWVESEIKDDYKDWKPGQKIFISSQTGTGKTTFILKKLLPYYAEQGKKILILVNRRILRDQLESILIDYDNSDYISVRTYQSLERGVCEFADNKIQGVSYLVVPDTRNFPNERYNAYIMGCAVTAYHNQIDSYEKYIMYNFQKYDCVVCDECHYFLMDSNFNTNTCLSYRLIQKAFYNKVQIYMSATIEPLKQYMMNENSSRVESTYLYGYKSVQLIQNKFVWKNKGIEPREYTVDKNYSYIDVEILRGTYGLIDVIKNQPVSKWLIFVDSIMKGRRLQNEIKDELKNINQDGSDTDEFSVAYVDADYGNDGEGLQTVGEIVRKEKFQEKILIATSVMDNGINIVDEELRNIVIMVDTETEFIQMLGRKREDRCAVKLYILMRDQEHFVRRCNNLKRLIEIYKEYEKTFIEEVETPLKRDNTQMQESYNQRLFEGNIIERYNFIEKEVVQKKHCEIMRKLAEHFYQYDDISKMFYVCHGTFLLNRLSVENLKKMYSYYKEVVNSFKPNPETEDDFAFVRRQLQWLGKTDTEINKIIDKFSKSEWDKAWGCVNETLKKLVDKEMSAEENKRWKNENQNFRDSLRVLMREMQHRNDVEFEDHSKIKTIEGVAAKSSNALSKPCMDFLRKYCNLPYVLEVKDKVYTYHYMPIESDE